MNSFKREDAGEGGEGMSLVSDSMSLTCLWGIRWSNGWNLGVDWVVPPQSRCGSSMTGGQC